jgi:hypothetical protein
MKIDKIVLCYPDMDRILVEKPKNGAIEDALSRFDLSKVVSLDVTVSLTLEEFRSLQGMGQLVVSGPFNSSNVLVTEVTTDGPIST